MGGTKSITFSKMKVAAGTNSTGLPRLFARRSNSFTLGHMLVNFMAYTTNSIIDDYTWEVNLLGQETVEKGNFLR